MEKDNQREFLSIVADQELNYPEHIQLAIDDPEVIDAFNKAFPEVGIYHYPYDDFCKLLDEKYGIGINSKAERLLIIELLRQKRIDRAIEGLIDV